MACMEKHDIGLAVLDVLMPGISGDAVAERLLRVNPDLPVLLMTGSAEFADRERPAGADEAVPARRARRCGAAADRLAS